MSLAVSASASQAGRDQIARARAESLQEQCTGEGSDSDLAPQWSLAIRPTVVSSHPAIEISPNRTHLPANAGLFA